MSKEDPSLQEESMAEKRAVREKLAVYVKEHLGNELECDARFSFQSYASTARTAACQGITGMGLVGRPT